MMKVSMISAFALLVVASVGCQTCPVQVAKNQPADRPNEAPLIVDEAMQARTWEPSTARYTNGDTMAWPTLFRYEPAWGQPDWTYAVLETPLFVTQVVGMPIMLVATPVWNDTRYTGVTKDPTNNAMPAPPTTPEVAVEAPPAEPAPVEPAPEPAAEPATQP